MKRSGEKPPPENPQPPTAALARDARLLTPVRWVRMPDAERLRRYDKLVHTMSANCPLGNEPSPEKARRWRSAYNALFTVVIAGEA